MLFDGSGTLGVMLQYWLVSASTVQNGPHHSNGGWFGKHQTERKWSAGPIRGAEEWGPRHNTHPITQGIVTTWWRFQGEDINMQIPTNQVYTYNFNMQTFFFSMHQIPYFYICHIIIIIYLKHKNYQFYVAFVFLFIRFLYLYLICLYKL